MTYELQYSVLRYSPSPVSGETINLGILLVDAEAEKREFFYSRKFNRIKNFDDEVDVPALKNILKGIQAEVDNYWAEGNYTLESFIKYYINAYYFDTPRRFQYSDWDTAVSELKHSYFRFDYAPSERPTRESDQKLLEKLLKENSSCVKKDQIVIGGSKDQVRYDYVTDDLCLKFFDYDRKNLDRCLNSAKVWAWNSEHNATNKKVWLVYRYSDKDSAERQESFNIIEDIMKTSNVNFLSLEEAINQL